MVETKQRLFAGGNRGFLISTLSNHPIVFTRNGTTIMACATSPVAVLTQSHNASDMRLKDEQEEVDPDQRQQVLEAVARKTYI